MLIHLKVFILVKSTGDILFSLFNISIVWSRQTPGISLKLAGNVPLPSVITFKTDVKLEFVNASRGVTDVFL